MTAAELGLMTGLVIPPLLLLWLGHGYRKRLRVARGTFWGGVGGYLLATAVVAVTAMVPPAPWTGGTRAWLIHWSLLAGPALGAAAGATLARLIPRVR